MTDNISFEDYMYDHKTTVLVFMGFAWHELKKRSLEHDASKMVEPERSMFEQYHERMLQLTFGSPEYMETVKEMGVPLKHHYEQNRHHPEHFENGINGMNLLDLIEMVCDWIAVSKAKGVEVNMEAGKERFGISDQLAEILQNTIDFLEK